MQQKCIRKGDAMPCPHNKWSKKWHAQLNEPEPDAPIERKTGKRHIYLRLDRYVQSVIQRQLRKGECAD